MVRVDVLIPCYGYGHFLEECAESALSQAGVDVRVLVIDDASPDNTEHVGRTLAARDSRVTYRRHVTNQGHIATYNEAIDWATGDYLLLLSADDYLVPGALARATALMEKRTEVTFVFGNAVMRFADGACENVLPFGNVAEKFRILTARDFITACGSTNIVPTPTAVVRTSVQKNVGGYLPHLPHSGDLEMWLRLCARGSVGFINEPQGVYRRHDVNMSRNYDVNHGLPDLLQRRAALMAFFEGSHNYLAGNPDLKEFLLRDLSRVAMLRASRAFNRWQFEGMRESLSFATETYPRIRRSLPWLKLAIKRAVGPNAWRRFSMGRT